MLTPHSPAYGYGWIVDDFGGHRLTAHGGNAPGFISMMQRWVDDDLCVIVLSNRAAVPVHTIANALAAIALGEYYEPPTIRSPIEKTLWELAEYQGRYELSTGEIRSVELKQNRLMAQRGTGPDLELLPFAPDKFYYAHDPMTTLTFIRGRENKITAHILRQSFDRDTAWIQAETPRGEAHP
jgi:hypothetical protein